MDKSGLKKKKLYINKYASIVQPSNLSDLPLNAKAAEQRIQDIVILKAWRQQRNRNRQLEADIKNLTNQAEGLQLQVYALRQLLDSEKSRVIHANNDLRRVLTSIEECKREKQALIKENNQLEARLRIMEDRLTEIENNFKNQKNELLTAKAEGRTWEKQLEKEREKLLRMESERKLFEEDIPETKEESKETGNNSNGRKTSRESRGKSISCKSATKNSGKRREDRGVGKVDFGKNISFQALQNPVLKFSSEYSSCENGSIT